MRIRDDFTVFPRGMKSGKVIWYYQTYDENGQRTTAHSTGESTKTAAVKKCNALLKEGKLLEKERNRIPSFREFAKGWWNPETCLYIQKKLARRKLTDEYTKQNRRMTELHLVPYFGNKRLDLIIDDDIDKWLITFGEREKRSRTKRAADGSALNEPFSNGYINRIFSILHLMLDEAVKRRIIKYNPANNVELLPVEPKNVEILTIAEFQELAQQSSNQLLDVGAGEYDPKIFRRELAKAANMLAACTGMRIGEVLGLRGEFVYADFIRVCGQYGRTASRSADSLRIY